MIRICIGRYFFFSNSAYVWVCARLSALYFIRFDWWAKWNIKYTFGCWAIEGGEKNNEKLRFKYILRRIYSNMKDIRLSLEGGGVGVYIKYLIQPLVEPNWPVRVYFKCTYFLFVVIWSHHWMILFVFFYRLNRHNSASIVSRNFFPTWNKMQISRYKNQNENTFFFQVNFFIFPNKK